MPQRWPVNALAAATCAADDAVVIGDEVDCQPQVAKASAASNAVQVRLACLGKDQVTSHIDTLVIYSRS